MPTDDLQGDFHFDLPEALIAQDPREHRSDSRLLLVEPGCGRVDEKVFRDLPDLLRSGDLLVVNESRVLPARLWTRREDTDGKIEILLIRPTSDDRTWLAMARPGRRLRPGVRLVLEGAGPEGEGPTLEVVEKFPDGTLLVRGETDPGELADSWGVMPLPPYIKRDAAAGTSARAARSISR